MFRVWCFQPSLHLSHHFLRRVFVRVRLQKVVHQTEQIEIRRFFFFFVFFFVFSSSSSLSLLPRRGSPFFWTRRQSRRHDVERSDTIFEYSFFFAGKKKSTNDKRRKALQQKRERATRANVRTCRPSRNKRLCLLLLLLPRKKKRFYYYAWCVRSQNEDDFTPANNEKTPTMKIEKKKTASDTLNIIRGVVNPKLKTSKQHTCSPLFLSFVLSFVLFVFVDTSLYRHSLKAFV